MSFGVSELPLRFWGLGILLSVPDRPLTACCPRIVDQLRVYHFIAAFGEASLQVQTTVLNIRKTGLAGKRLSLLGG